MVAVQDNCGKKLVVRCQASPDIWSEDYDWEAPSVAKEVDFIEVYEYEVCVTSVDPYVQKIADRRAIWLKEYEESRECASTSGDTPFNWYSRGYQAEEQHHTEEARLNERSIVPYIEFWPRVSAVRKAGQAIRKLYKARGVLKELQEKFMKSYIEQRPCSSYTKAQEELIAILESQLQAVDPACTVQPYGGSHNGFGTNTSDLDLSVMSCSAMTITEALSVLDAEGNRTVSGLKEVENLELVNVPLAKMEFERDGHNLDVDFCIGNSCGVMNTKLLKVYANIDERAGQLMTLVKSWAKANSLHGGQLYRFNTYSLVNLVINYLQRGVSPPILPVLHELVPDIQIRLEEGQSLEQLEQLFSWTSAPAGKATAVAELLIGFFAYYAQFNFSEWCIDIRRTQLTNRYSVGSHDYENEETRLSIVCPVGGRSPTRRFTEECYLNFRRALNTMNELIWKEMMVDGGSRGGDVLEKIVNLLGI